MVSHNRMNPLIDPTQVTLPISAKRSKTVQGGRQSYSCAECRRLKLKCTRIWPCGSCEKRGCAQICPEGQMITGKGKRLILADTEELHHRISELELALSQAHSLVSGTPHPLLASPYLFSPREPAAESRKTVDPLAKEGDVIDGGRGTLAISSQGEARFVGSFAGSEYLRAVEVDNMDIGLATPPPSARDLGPELPVGGSGGMERLREQLPVWETEGRLLVEVYWENVNWMYQILPRPMFDSDHLLNAYDQDTEVNAHKIACVYLLMALGAMFDLNRPPYDQRAAELFRQGKICLDAMSFEHSSPATVQALHLCGTYLLNDRGNGGEAFWPMLGTAVKIAHSLGLHRDGEAFGLSEYEIAERRQVWWEIITYDRLQALCFGRPCSTSNKASDTLVPDGDLKFAVDTDGYHRAKYRLVAMMEKIIDIQTQTSPVSVHQVNSLDKEFRGFKSTVPEALLPNTPIQDLPLDPSVHPHMVIHRLGLRLLIAQSRLLLNRPLFALAMREDADPSSCKFGESFVGLYESAQEIVQLVKQLVIYHPSLISRWWFFWFHAFTASVCLSAIAIHAPDSAFASPAFQGLSAVCDISAAAAPECRAKRGLPMLIRLRQRASEALVAAGKTRPGSWREDGDLSHLQSPTRLLRINSLVKKSSPNSESSVVETSPQSVATSVTLIEPVHYDPVAGNLVAMSQTSLGVAQPWGVSQNERQYQIEQDWPRIFGFSPGDGQSAVGQMADFSGASTNDVEFDFDMFINQIGAGELGLGSFE